MKIRELCASIAGRNREERRVRIVVCIAVLVSLMVCVSLGVAYHKRMKVQDVHATMEKWQEQADYINAQNYRPVHAKQLDAVAAELLGRIPAHNMGMISYHVLNQQNGKQEYQAYVLSVRGTYTDTLSFLEDFRAKDALITIASVKMYPVNDQIETEVCYRVYLK